MIRKYPVGIQNFEDLRKEGYCYVDKTELMYQLVQSGKYYFLSRPRRFGKSLLLSTIQAYFEGKKELFHGLAVEQLEQEWNTYPILHLDLNARKYDSAEALMAILNQYLESWETIYGDEKKDRAPEERFAYLIEMFGLIPWVISMMVAALLWRWLFNGDLGLFNMIVKALGGNPIYVVENETSAVIALIFVLTWRLVGYAMIMILAGLKGLDTTLIEAAKVDGASSWQILWRVKLPLIKTQMLLSTIVLTVSNFTNNTVPKVLTSGGPNDATNVITLFQYNLGFRYYQFGTSAALSIIVMLITSLIIILYIKVSKYKI